MTGSPDLPFWPRPNRFLESLRGRRPAQSFMWMTLASSEVIEMAGGLGLDCVVIDMEHTSSGLATVQQLVTVAQGVGMTALVRVDAPTADVARILDLGAQGIVYPHIGSVEQATAAAAAMQYPPRGRRGWSGAHARSVRWAGTNTDGSTDARLFGPEYLAAADASLARIFMIEDEDGAAAIDDILEGGQPDGVVFGWGDFAVSVGFDANRVSKARQAVLDACRRRGVGIAISVVPPDPTEFYPGCFFSAGVDSTLVSAALQVRLAAARAAARSQGGPQDPEQS